MNFLSRISSVAASPILATALALSFGTAASAATLAGVGTYEGVAGIGTANGDVAASPMGSKYVYVTTNGSSYEGPGGAGGLDLGSETNGSELTTNAFAASAGDVLDYYFNYISSDGTSNYIEYAYAFLNNLTDGTKTLIFTARTNPNPLENAVPGFGMPDIAPGVTLNPSSVLMLANQTNWSELGEHANTCWSTGCGQTGWINSKYTIADAGNYSFTFGVFNWGDTDYDSGLAIAGLKVGGVVIVDPNEPAPVPLPAAGWLMIAGLGGMGALARKRKSA